MNDLIQDLNDAKRDEQNDLDALAVAARFYAASVHRRKQLEVMVAKEERAQRGTHLEIDPF